ncbi:MAG: hypothetical protein QF415_08380 [Candidatus Undinarchaeales archaeon]|nr:hypothetical protein [Candidatus Undinarchaeales archaeon]MDP7494217.1 hypothetical protein [Candidatus Undinarchaeales archaeon]
MAARRVLEPPDPDHILAAALLAALIFGLWAAPGAASRNTGAPAASLAREALEDGVFPSMGPTGELGVPTGPLGTLLHVAVGLVAGTGTGPLVHVMLLVHLATAFLVSRIGRAVGGAETGLLAGLFYLTLPFTVTRYALGPWQGGYLPLVVSLVALSMVRSFKTGKARPLVALWFALGCAVQLEPLAYLLIPAVAVARTLLGRSVPAGHMVPAVLFLATMLLPYGVWAYSADDLGELASGAERTVVPVLLPFLVMIILAFILKSEGAVTAAHSVVWVILTSCIVLPLIFGRIQMVTDPGLGLVRVVDESGHLARSLAWPGVTDGNPTYLAAFLIVVGGLVFLARGWKALITVEQGVILLLFLVPMVAYVLAHPFVEGMTGAYGPGWFVPLLPQASVLMAAGLVEMAVSGFPRAGHRLAVWSGLALSIYMAYVTFGIAAPLA